MEAKSGTVITIVILLVVVAVLVILLAMSYSTYNTTTYHQSNLKVANEIVMENYRTSGARSQDAYVDATNQWIARAYLHRGLIDASLARHASAVTAALERLESQANVFGATYHADGTRAHVNSSLVQGLQVFDQAMLEASQNHAVGDIPSYEAALASASASHLLIGMDTASLSALADYQSALVSYMRATARGAHAPAYIELDKAVVASQALGNALLHASLSDDHETAG